MKLKTIIPLTDPSVLSRKARAFYKEALALDRGYGFHLIDGELYVEETRFGGKDSELLRHWSIQEGDDDDNVKGYSLPFVRANGEYLFEIRRTGSYETSAISPIDGKAFVVHD